mmetsp:Transcript_10417/g.38393  ORF Transcript_10417/g.38393 Transcript_10417/m.38393 type:complete len:440 (+) Transcript_10417:119-1438(+)
MWVRKGLREAHGLIVARAAAVLNAPAEALAYGRAQGLSPSLGCSYTTLPNNVPPEARAPLPIARSIGLLTTGAKRSITTGSAHQHGARTLEDARKPTDFVTQSKSDPYSIVAEELNIMSQRMREQVASEVPALSTAAEYFFRAGAEGKRFRPTVLLLLASATCPKSSSLENEQLRRRQRTIAEITEMIHVASLLHDDVIDESDSRRGMESVNAKMGNKLAILAGDFLLARASISLAKLGNVEVINLLSTVIEHLVKGEVMQMNGTAEDRRSIDYYVQKTYYKTASLVSNSAKSIVLLAEPSVSRETACLAQEYGRHLGLAFQLVDDVLDFTGSAKTLGKPALSDLGQGIATAPVLFAAEEYPQLVDLIQRRFRREGDVDQALLWIEKSSGIERTEALARSHVEKAKEAIHKFPQTACSQSLLCRDALLDISEDMLRRRK